MTTILVVDDERNIVDVVRYALEREGLTVQTAGDGRAALAALETHAPDLIVLDILMPELDGLSVCRAIRAHGTTPIIFLTSRSDEVDRVVGLELGGDDYVTKPFSPRELVSRVKAVLRRTQAQPSPAHDDEPPLLQFGRIVVDSGRHQVRVGEVPVELTATEFNLLRALLERPRRVLSREQLIARVYREATHVTARTMDTHVRRIRAKLRALGVDPIQTVHGVGYKACDRAEP